MLKKSITYTDYNDVEVTEDFYFNFTKIEIAEMLEIEYEGGLEDTIKKLTETDDVKKAYELFKKLILDAYGVKSEDGKRFLKSPELRADFEASPALSELIIEFLQNPSLGAVFIEGTLPKAMVEAVKAAKETENKGLHVTPDRPARGTRIVEKDQDVTAAADDRVEGATPVDAGIRMSTAEKRQYTEDELAALGNGPGTVPTQPVAQPVEHEITGEPSDEQLLAMRPQDMTPAQLQRAYALKSQ